jgi:hypothetical protein
MSLLKVARDLTPMYRHKIPPTLLFKSRCKNLPLIMPCIYLFFIYLFSVFVVSNVWQFFGFFLGSNSLN